MPLPGARAGSGSAVVGDRIYLVGGFDADDIASDTVEVFDTGDEQWHRLRPMPTKRGLLKAVKLGRSIYAVGGSSADGAHTTTEVYNPATDRWHLLDARFADGRASLIAVHRHGEVLAIGGFEPRAGIPTALDRVDALRKATRARRGRRCSGGPAGCATRILPV